MAYIVQAVIIVVALFIIGHRRKLHEEIGNLGRILNDELQSPFPIFSAETTDNVEAEYIRDRLPKRLPMWAIPLAIITFCGLVWWITD